MNQIQAVAQWRGTVSFTYSISGSDGVLAISQQRTASVSATLNLRSSDGTAFLGSPVGQGSINDVRTHWGNLWSAVAGSGQPLPYDAESNSYSRVRLNFSGERYQYHWDATVYIDAIDSGFALPV